MTSPQNSKSESQILAEIIIARITRIHASISKIDSLRTSRLVNDLFTHLVKLCTLPLSICTLPLSIDVKALPKEVQSMGESLIVLSSQFSKQSPERSWRGTTHEGCLRGFGSNASYFYYFGYTSHEATHFDNFDIDEAANDVARRIVATDAELEKRMKFLTCDIMEVKEKLGEYDCILLAALAGMTKEEKVKILGHIKKHMKNGGVLLARSAKGARAFLYPVVEEDDLLDFEVLSIFHPINDVINSVVLVRKAIC
ncbi:hypothetical protein Pint_14160 [Pistacia integerrima]|uniref:Uncharacterized protein n=1 Tax=Pistacia integerrima TaxID=434235 RepID=A0ACC0Y7K1_9ROSI|nr:hypothetical protein Pint_14160 [Pistacia integerrima]